jgi:hypothetical protein
MAPPRVSAKTSPASKPKTHRQAAVRTAPTRPSRAPPRAAARALAEPRPLAVDSDGFTAGSTRGVTAADWQSSSNKTTRSAYFPASGVLAAGRNGVGVLDKFLDQLQGSEINAIVLDIKEGDGAVLFNASRPPPHSAPGFTPALEASMKKNTARSAPDLKVLVDRLHARGFKAVIRQVLFKDEALVRTNPGSAILDKTTQRPWGNTKMWISPYNPQARAYNIELAKRGLAAGADEIQFDYIRFPDQGTGDRKNAVHPDNRSGQIHAEAITSFLKEAREEIKRDYPNAKLGADVFGYVANGTNRKDELGQDVGEMAKYLDVIWPMQYPSHWAAKGQQAFGSPHPETKPREIYEATTKALIRQIGDRKDQVEIRPWLQAFTINSFGGVKMIEPARGDLGPYVLRQKEGLKSGDGNGYALWGSVGSQLESLRSLPATTPRS